MITSLCIYQKHAKYVPCYLLVGYSCYYLFTIFMLLITYEIFMLLEEYQPMLACN